MTKPIHKGQVALILVLIMTVVSSLAVSLASRSTVDTRIQQTESEGVQALISAQTGLEQLILNPNPENNTVTGDTYTATKSESGADSLEAGLMETGSSVEINLSPANDKITGFTVYWSPSVENPGGQPSIFVSVIKNSGEINDYAYGYEAINGFIVADNGADGYAKKTSSIPLDINVLKIRLTVLGAPARLRVVPIGDVFPPQLNTIKSIGSVTQPGSSTAVKYGLQYDESSFDTTPSVFDYALFSGGSIIQ